MNQNGYAQLMLNDNQLVFMGTDPSTFDFHMYKVTFGSTAVNWANKILSISGMMMTVSNSDSILSKDSSYIYSFFTWGGISYLYFMTFSVSDGSIYGSRYISSTTWTINNGLSLSGNYLASSTYCSTGYHVVLFYIPTSSFTIKLFSGIKADWI